MMADMYSVMTRITEIRKRFGIHKSSSAANNINFEQALQNNVQNNVRNESRTGLRVAKNQAVQSREAVYTADALRQMARETAISRGVPPGLVDAVIQAESSYNPRAVSPKGAQGLMQLMPRVSAMMGVEDPYSPRENLDAGVGMLKTLLDKYGGDYKKALGAYNAGEKAVDENGGIPPYRETREYVRKVLDNYLKNAQ